VASRVPQLPPVEPAQGRGLAQGAQPANRRFGLLVAGGDETRDGPAAARDHDLLAPLYAVKQIGQVGLGFEGADVHCASNWFDKLV